MIRIARWSTQGVLAFALIATALQSPASANHSWGGYHWARTSNPFTVNLGDNVSSTWDSGGYLQVASNDWTQSSVLDTYVVPGRAKGRCRPTSGRVEVCNASYGNTGWLGVAQIWVSGLHITQGTVRLNDTYFNTPTYDSPEWRQLVTCQEIGHTFGLAHQDEDFYNANLGTCMDYTIDPSTNQHPNAHDYEELETIYNDHLDLMTSAIPTAISGVDLESPAAWGQLMKSARGGRMQVFERDFGKGQKIVTFVFWA